MADIIQGKKYNVSCSHCGGAAKMISEPRERDFTDGYFQCNGMVYCQFSGSGEEFSFQLVEGENS